jgi:colanic acid biosynthesis glycosyl transferase WcaI
MKALILSCVYPPEPVTSAVTSESLANMLSAEGHEVTVLAPFPNRPQGSIYPGYTRCLWATERSDRDFSIIRCFATFSKRSGIVSRFVENVSFGITSGLALLFVRRPDIVYSNTWPLFAAGILVFVAWLRRVPVVMSVQDLYPESLVKQERLGRHSIAVRWMACADRTIATRASAVLLPARTFTEVYRDSRRIPENRIHWMPNWINPRMLECASTREACRRDLGIPAGALLYVYSGNIGVAAGLDQFIAEITARAECREIFLMAGSGGKLAACEEAARNCRARTVRFHTYYPQSETAKVLKAADVLLLPTYGEQAFASLPSKLIWYMLAARPILAIASPGSELDRVIRTVNCGWVVSRTSELNSALDAVSETPAEELARRGELGRRFAQEHFTEEACLPPLYAILRQAAGRGGSPFAGSIKCYRG